MKVASLENCKRLYELSGWDETGLEYSLYDGSVIKVDGKSTGSPKFVVAYNSDYLLGKFPRYVGVYKVVDYPEYYATADGMNGEEVTADTPADALTLLAIKLFEENILKKGK